MPELRRLVTVVFADVVGSTALAEELDAEDVRSLLTRYYALASGVITAHGGVIAKLLGDGVLACFGVPTAHGDDVVRALDAALALRDAVARDPALQRLALRIGVNTGEVLASDDPTGEIVGDAVNVAARVTAAAGEGEILAADVTHRAAAAIVFGDAREISAKGKSQPVRVWPVQGRAPESDAHGSGPFVGRSDDLEQLELVARRAFRDRRPYLVTITAPPGMGKSRLAHEFRARMPAGTRYAHAHCPPYGETLAYGPLRELVAGLFGRMGDAAPDELRHQLAAALGGPEAERDATLIALTIAPERESAEHDRDRIIGAWRHLVDRIASDGPLLIVLEDVQNASDSLLELVEQMARPPFDVPLVVVALARPELAQRRSSWGRAWPNSLHLSLDPLPDADIATLVARLLEVEPPPALRDLVVDRSAGNPFFAEELVRALLERGHVDLGDPEAVAGALRALPETVQATLLARIDLLPADERAVLQAAAVVGRTFTTPVLRTISDLPGSQIDAAVASLLERDLVLRTPQGELAFRNALIRDVAYGMLPRARRARDHALVAQRLEVTAGDRIDELAGIIGMHFLESTRLRRLSAVPVAIEGAGEEATRAAAVRWLSRAARANAAAAAWSEGILQLQDAIAIANEDERVQLLLQLGETAAGGDIGWDALSEALRLWRARPHGDPMTGARVIVAMLLTIFRSAVSLSPDRLPDPVELERLAAEALALARRCDDESVLASALMAHASLERSRADRSPASLRAARDEARQAAEIFERRGTWTLWSVAVDAWAAIVGDLGDLVAADELAMRRIARLGDLSALERAHANWTVPIYAMALGDIQRARAHVRAALDQPSFVNSRWAHDVIAGEIFLVSWRAAVHWALGDWDAALADARECLADIIPRMPDGPMRSLFRDSGCAALYVARRRGRDDEVAEVSPQLRRWCDDERSLALLEDDPTRLDVALDHVETAGIDTWQIERSVSLLAAYGRVPVGVPRLGQLIAFAEERRLRPLAAQLLRLRARATGDADDARRAHALLVACGMAADAALAAVELASYGDATHLAAGRATLERLGDVRGLALARRSG